MQKHKGFTLIELLVVITVLGILITLGLSSFNSTKKNARDTQRKSDLSQYREALEGYYTNNNSYPNESGNSNAGTGIFAAAGSIVTEYLPAVLPDPLNNATYNYVYTYTDSQTYNLCSKLELGNYWMVCSSGFVGQTSSCSCTY